MGGPGRDGAMSVTPSLPGSTPASAAKLLDQLPRPARTWILTASNAGVSLARSIIGMRCEPSPAHEAHCAMPAVGRPGTEMVTESGALPPLLSSVATKNAGTGDGSGASLRFGSIRQAVWK